MVLITGVTGSGKSTTLASLIGKINETQHKHIISIKDPIEFIHRDKGCLINQRSLGQDATSFTDALRSALREDPDIIVVGEMRDLETIDRIIGMFPMTEQNRVRTSLGSVLEGVISQRLVKKVDGGRIPAVEVLKKSARIQQLIFENRDYEIPDALFEGKDRYRTQTFDQSLVELYEQRLITQEEVMRNATNPADMRLKLQGIGRGAVSRENLDANVLLREKEGRDRV
jgi:twitching motility protein PilT